MAISCPYLTASFHFCAPVGRERQDQGFPLRLSKKARPSPMQGFEPGRQRGRLAFLVLQALSSARHVASAPMVPLICLNSRSISATACEASRAEPGGLRTGRPIR
jgi:hypothetical protein